MTLDLYKDVNILFNFCLVFKVLKQLTVNVH
jgi:hypothetical protein